MSQLKIFGRKKAKKHEEYITRREKQEERRSEAKTAQKERLEAIKEIREETWTLYRKEPTVRRTDMRRVGDSDGWQLTFTAEFIHAETDRERGPFQCFSNFHKKREYFRMFEEAKVHGQSQAQGEYESGVGDEDWVMINVHSIRYIRYMP